jgi:hypothetical protein
LDGVSEKPGIALALLYLLRLRRGENGVGENYHIAPSRASRNPLRQGFHRLFSPRRHGEVLPAEQSFSAHARYQIDFFSPGLTLSPLGSRFIK